MDLVSISAIGFLLVISYQDFNERLIHWFYFPLVALLLLVQPLRFGQTSDQMVTIGINLIILVFMLSLTTFIYCARHRQVVFIVDKVIGLADVLALVLACLAFSPVNLVFFMLLAFVGAIVFQLLMLPFSEKARHIPLAGIVCFLLSVAITLQDGFMLFDLTNDFFVLGLIANMYY